MPPPYADAVCGTHLCGEAICGTWWAYPEQSPLGFGIIGLAIVPASLLGFLGIVPRAGQWWTFPDVCTDVPLATDVEQSRVLVADVERELVLSPQECR